MLHAHFDSMMFYCRSWVIFQWRCWRWCWWARSWWCIQVTLRVTTTAVHTSPASPWVQSVERSLCWPPCAATGVTLWLDGRHHQLLDGSHISWGSWLNVNTCTFVSLFTHLHKHTVNPWIKAPGFYQYSQVRPRACNRGPACIGTSALQQTDGRQHVSPNNHVFHSIDNAQTFIEVDLPVELCGVAQW